MIRVINLLRRFWLGETINYNNEFFSFKDVFSGFYTAAKDVYNGIIDAFKSIFGFYK